MHYVGIDLAWGQRNPTGLAVLDPHARLLHLAAVRTDEEIEAGLAPYVAGPCVVGVDAPLVVVNETGSRPAEKALSKDFHPYDAGTHPTNLGKPEFRDGPRGGRVCKRLRLDLDPRSRRPRRALEVYPHAATVVLFGLEKVLRYKNKPGRDLELLRGELLRLMTLLEGLVVVSDTWRALRVGVEQATRKVDLRRVEDQVDAVVCAYVALLADTRPDEVTTYGDRDTGYIVTPTLGRPPSAPPDPDPLPPPPPGPTRHDHAEVVRTATAAYAAEHPGLVAAGEVAVALVTSILDEAGIDYLSVTGRTKTVASFSEKAGRSHDGRPLYTDPLTQITDQVGVRVITYVRDDVAAVAELLADQVVVTDDRDLGRETARQGRFGYASRHLMITLDAARESHPAFEQLRGRTAQVQVRTVLQHAWAEFEHDIRYKGVVPPEHAGEFDRRFTLAAGLLELADREFSEVRERLRGGAPSPSGALDGLDGVPGEPRIEPRELAAYLAGQYSDAGWSRLDHYGWTADLLEGLGVTTLIELGEVLRRADEPAIAERMDYRHPPGAVRRLDDALLWVFGEQYVALAGNAHRVELLQQRLGRMRGEA